MSNTFLDYLREYIILQVKLIRTIETNCGQITEYLENVPKKGVVYLEKKCWHFQKHGIGICFTEDHTKKKIDIHKNSKDPYFFDLWRLRTFFGSLGKKGDKVVSNFINMNEGKLSDKIMGCLDKLIVDNVIKTKDDGYYIVDSRDISVF